MFLALTLSLSSARQVAPRGVNTWDSYGGPVDETGVRKLAPAIVDQLLPSGYNILTIDEGWQEDHGQSLLDAYGRPIPNPEMYPSTRSTTSLKPIADYLHGLGLKLGVWLLRGIPRLAVDKKLPVFGTPYFAHEIAVKSDTCVWNGLCYGLNASHPGSQAYLDSVIEQLAQWDVDYVKIDCIFGTRDLRLDEIVMFGRAFNRSARTRVMQWSLSPGVGANVEQATFLRDKVGVASLFRVTDDLHDDWRGGCDGGVYRKFTVVQEFVDFVGVRSPREGGSGNEIMFPDLDMLPMGYFPNPPFASNTCGGPRVGCGRWWKDGQAPCGEPRKSKLSFVEQQVVMSLWAVYGAPLIFGGDLPTDKDTLTLLTNPEILDLQANGLQPSMVFWDDKTETGAWAAKFAHPTTGKLNVRWVALFNGNDAPQTVNLLWKQVNLSKSALSGVRNSWNRTQVAVGNDGISITLGPHTSAVYEFQLV